MAEMTMNLSMTVTLSRAELRLVTMALAGRLKDRDVEAAKELNLKLLERQVQLYEQHGDLFKGALESARDDFEGWLDPVHGVPAKDSEVEVRLKGGTILRAMYRGQVGTPGGPEPRFVDEQERLIPAKMLSRWRPILPEELDDASRGE